MVQVIPCSQFVANGDVRQDDLDITVALLFELLVKAFKSVNGTDVVPLTRVQAACDLFGTHGIPEQRC